MASFEEAMVNNSTKFDLLALLRLLKEYGYNSIWFESNDSSASEVSLIDKITFEKSRVIITLNIGLLSPQNELPSYFFHFRDTHLEVEDNFAVFLRYFDHILISNYIQNMYPAINGTYFTDWRDYNKTFLRLTNIKTVKTIHFIFASVYPELHVDSRVTEGLSSIEKDKKSLGEIRLGTLYQLGDVYASCLSGISVTLLPGKINILIQEIIIRLNKIVLPLLSESDFYLEVKMSGVMTPLKTGELQCFGFKKLLEKEKKDEIIIFSGRTNRYVNIDSGGITADRKAFMQKKLVE
jgi:hypothetical protein